MKKIKISFLFFLLFAIGMVNLNCLNAQVQTGDSLSYFYLKINNPQTANDLPEAYRYFSKHKEQNLAQKDTLAAIYDLRLIAIGEYKLGLIYESENSAVEALRLIDRFSRRDSTLIVSRMALYNHLGIVYRNLEAPKRAIAIYNKALIYASALKDSITLRNNKGNVYKDLTEYEMAIRELEWVYQKSVESNDIVQAVRALDNLGVVQSKLNMPEGLKNIEQALDIRLNGTDNSNLYASYKHLTEYYSDSKDKTKAIQYAELGKEAATAVGVSFKKDALSQLLKLSDDPNTRAYIRLSDSLTTANSKKNNRSAGIKYNLAEEQKRTQEAEIEGEKQSKLKLLAQAIGIGILLVGIFLFALIRARYKKEKLQQVYNTEVRISKKVHDEVANDVYQVMTKLQTIANDTDEILDDLEDIYVKTRDISKESSAIEVAENFDVLLNDLLLGYQNTEVNVITKNMSKIEWDSVPDLKKTTLYRIMQELMTNMRKHSQATLVVITANQQGKRVHINYTDNGVGSLIKKHNGLQNVENRIKAINGTISFDSQIGKGFYAKITI